MFHFWCFLFLRSPGYNRKFPYPLEVKKVRSFSILYHSIIMTSFSSQDFSNVRKYFYLKIKIKNVSPEFSGRFQGFPITPSELWEIWFWSRLFNSIQGVVQNRPWMNLVLLQNFEKQSNTTVFEQVWQNIALKLISRCLIM